MREVKSTFSFPSVSSSGLCVSEGKGANHEMESDSHIILKFLRRTFRNHLGGWLRDLKMKEGKLFLRLVRSSLRKPKSSEGWTQSPREGRRFALRAKCGHCFQSQTQGTAQSFRSKALQLRCNISIIGHSLKLLVTRS